MKKKVLFINGHLNVGGVEKSLIDILRNMDYDQYEIELLLLEELGDYKEEIPKQVKVHLLSLKNTYGSIGICLLKCIRQKDWFSIKMRLIFLSMKLRGQKNIKKAKYLLTNGQYYDYVIGFRSGICTQIAAFAVNAGKRITWWHHGEFNVSAKEYVEVIRECDIIVSVSSSCAEMILENIPEVENKLVVIPNMVDLISLRKKCTIDSPYSNNMKHFVTVCRISAEKHIENVIYATRYLKEKGFLFQWHIVGDGILRRQMEELARKNCVQDYLKFEGSKVNPYPYIKYAYMYIHPSYVESQGLTILEAMALGVPCVVTKSRGPCEFIKDGENGLLVEKSSEALSQGLIKVLSNKVEYQVIKSNTKCPEEFAPKSVMKKIKEILKG